MFKAEQFTATKWETAEQKAKWANQFVKFCTSGFNPHWFTHAFYNRLRMTFGHIAHYNKMGFYNTFFVDDAGITDFLDITLQYPCYGDASWTYSDVEKILQEWLKQRGQINAIVKASRATQNKRIAFGGSHE